MLLHSEINLFEELMQYGILIRDCTKDRGLGDGWYRIAVRRKEENERLLKALEKIVHKNKMKKKQTGGGQ